MTFGHLTHTLSANTRVGCARRTVRLRPGGRPEHRRSDDAEPDSTRGTGVTSGAPQTFGALTISRTTAKATLSHYRPGLLGADHQWKIGGQVETGRAPRAQSSFRPACRFVDNNGQPSQADLERSLQRRRRVRHGRRVRERRLTVGDRLTINAGVRFDHSRAISQDLHALDPQGRETDAIVRGLGTLYTWNIWSPRLGVTAKLSADGRTMLRASYGRFSQGVLTGELEPFHPGVTPTTTAAFDPATGGYTATSPVVDPRATCSSIPTCARRTRTSSPSASIAKSAAGSRWRSPTSARMAPTSSDGRMSAVSIARRRGRCADGRTRAGVRARQRARPHRRFLLTNPDGLLADVQRPRDGRRKTPVPRLAGVWLLHVVEGLRAAALQRDDRRGRAGQHRRRPPQPLTFGRDPNDLTNARGRLPNDRPHMFRVMGSVDVPRTGFVVAANLQHFSDAPLRAVEKTAPPR